MTTVGSRGAPTAVSWICAITALEASRTNKRKRTGAYIKFVAKNCNCDGVPIASVSQVMASFFLQVFDFGTRRLYAPLQPILAVSSLSGADVDQKQVQLLLLRYGIPWNWGTERVDRMGRHS